MASPFKYTLLAVIEMMNLLVAIIVFIRSEVTQVRQKPSRISCDSVVGKNIRAHAFKLSYPGLHSHHYKEA